MLNSNLIFAERLKELMRERNEMTPTELAHALNCDKHAVSRWIHGANFPRFATLIKMTEFFNISIDFLLGLSDEETLNRLHTNTIFLDRLNLLLKEHQLTKYQLAKQLKIEQATISKWYKQNYIPETAILIALSKFFEVTIEYLVGFTDKNNYMIPLSI